MAPLQHLSPDRNGKTSTPKRASHALVLRPPAGALAEIATLRDAAGGAPVPDGALAMTLCWLGYEDEGSAARIAAVRKTLDCTRLSSCRVLLDRLVARPAALLLVPNEPLPALTALAADVAAALACHGVRPPAGWRFQPQLTLARGPDMVAPPVLPVAWTADAVELVRNSPGHRAREPMGRWALGNHARCATL